MRIVALRLSRTGLYIALALLAGLALLAMLSVFLAVPAFAADGDVTGGQSFTIPVAALTLYAAPLVPIVTAWATKLTASGWVKTAVNAGVAAVVGLVTTAIDLGTGLVLTWDTLWRTAFAIGLATLSYLVFKKPLEKVANATSGTGVG